VAAPIETIIKIQRPDSLLMKEQNTWIDFTEALRLGFGDGRLTRPIATGGRNMTSGHQAGRAVPDTGRRSREAEGRAEPTSPAMWSKGETTPQINRSLIISRFADVFSPFVAAPSFACDR
jgi:hypothetical protein